MGSAEKEGRRLIFVVNGCTSEKTRAMVAFRLLKWAFDELEVSLLYKQNTVIGDVAVKEGSLEKVTVAFKGCVCHTLKGFSKEVSVNLEAVELVGPQPMGTLGGYLIVSSPDLPEARFPLYTTTAVAKPSWWQKIYRATESFLLKLFHQEDEQESKKNDR